jgi:hypothetical protein
MFYIADQLNHSIRRLNPATGEVTTVAGDGISGYVDSVDIDTSDKNKDNDKIRFNNPLGVAVDATGVIYVTDFGNDVIRRIQKTSSGFTVDTFAGETRVRKNEETGFKERVGVTGFEDNVATLARFSGPDGIVAAPEGRLYVADAFNNMIRVITPGGASPTRVTSLFGNQFPGNVDGIGPSIRFNTPTGLALQGNRLLVADFGNHRLRIIDLAVPEAITLTGVAGAGNADGPRYFARLTGPLGVAALGDQLYVLDNLSNRIRRVEADGELSTVAGGPADFADGTGPKARFRTPRDLGAASSTQLFIVDQGNHRFRMIQN